MGPWTINRTKTIMPMAARTAPDQPNDDYNPGATGVQVQINVTAITGGGITVYIENKDPGTMQYYPVLTSAEIVAPGLVILRIHPAMTAIANLTANDVIANQWRVRTTHADGANTITYSVARIYTA